MRLEARKYLTDIQVARERIARFTQGKRFEHYLADEPGSEPELTTATRA